MNLITPRIRMTIVTIHTNRLKQRILLTIAIVRSPGVTIVRQTNVRKVLLGNLLLSLLLCGDNNPTEEP